MAAERSRKTLAAAPNTSAPATAGARHGRRDQRRRDHPEPEAASPETKRAVDLAAPSKRYQGGNASAAELHDMHGRGRCA